MRLPVCEAESAHSWIDEFRPPVITQHIRKPVPQHQCRDVLPTMDVSGSMSQLHKDIPKRFFILLYLFLEGITKIDLVFAYGTTSAKEVDEQEFSTPGETEGTIVSSALKLMQEITDQTLPGR